MSSLYTGGPKKHESEAPGTPNFRFVADCDSGKIVKIVVPDRRPVNPIE